MLHFINLSENNIGDSGATAIAEVSKASHVLGSINLDYNPIGSKGVSRLFEAWKANIGKFEIMCENFDITEEQLLAEFEGAKNIAQIPHLRDSR